MNEDEFVEANKAQEAGDKVIEKTEPVDVIEETGEPEELPKLSAMEQKAFDQGWRPEKEFDGPTDNWKTAKEYVKDGEWLAKIKELNQRVDVQKKDFDERLENTNKLNEARRKTEIDKLKVSQREAVEAADADLYDKAQKEIEELEKQVVEAPKDDAQTKDPAVSAWEQKNPWINDQSDEKTGIANSIYLAYANKNPGSTAQQALDHLDSRLVELYPATNPRRDAPSTSETTARTPKRKGKTLTMGDLTATEQSEWSQFGALMFKTEEAFLKAVTDSRKK